MSKTSLEYRTRIRSDRLHPHRFNNNHALLSLLTNRLRQIVNSDLITPGATVLDYGCAEKPYEPLFRDKFETYTGVDLSGNPHADIILEGDGRVPLHDKCCDCVLSTQVLEHVEDPHKYLLEANRVLRLGGRLILSTHGIYNYHPDPTDYWRWTIDGLELELERAGFRTIAKYGVLGLASTSLFLWQKATAPRVPRPARSLYCWGIQRLIHLCESLIRPASLRDACVYVFVAERSK